MPHEEFEVDNPEIKALLNKLAHKLGDEMPAGWGFTLFIFEYDPGKNLFYISSGQRKDMLKVLREFLQRNQ